jgi:hypothetical protein
MLYHCWIVCFCIRHCWMTKCAVALKNEVPWHGKMCHFNFFKQWDICVYVHLLSLWRIHFGFHFCKVGLYEFHIFCLYIVGSKTLLIFACLSLPFMRGMLPSACQVLPFHWYISASLEMPLHSISCYLLTYCTHNFLTSSVNFRRTYILEVDCKW